MERRYQTVFSWKMILSSARWECQSLHIWHPNMQPNADDVPMFLDEDLEKRLLGMFSEIIEKDFSKGP